MYGVSVSVSYAKNQRSLFRIAPMISVTQKKSVIGGINCRIPAMICPRIIRVIAPRSQLVKGMIARIKVTIQLSIPR